MHFQANTPQINRFFERSMITMPSWGAFNFRHHKLQPIKSFKTFCGGGGGVIIILPTGTDGCCSRKKVCNSRGMLPLNTFLQVHLSLMPELGAASPVEWHMFLTTCSSRTVTTLVRKLAEMKLYWCDFKCGALSLSQGKPVTLRRNRNRRTALNMGTIPMTCRGAATDKVPSLAAGKTSESRVKCFVCVCPVEQICAYVTWCDNGFY